MALPALNTDEKFTYAEYLSWPAGERWELICGEAYAMSPAPGTEHQSLVGYLFRKIADFLEGKSCRVFVSPVDVYFPEKNKDTDETIDTVVQPDIIVVYDVSKIESRGIRGAPDIAVEVLSDSTAYKDQTEKLALYEKHGVREYWIVNPGARNVQVFSSDGHAVYGKPAFYTADESIESRVLEGFVCDCRKLFGAV